ncbi:MAG: hypothetical protein ACKN9D_10760, partial [Actinomycetales bacterium]
MDSAIAYSFLVLGEAATPRLRLGRRYSAFGSRSLPLWQISRWQALFSAGLGTLVPGSTDRADYPLNADKVNYVRSNQASVSTSVG